MKKNNFSKFTFKLGVTLLFLLISKGFSQSNPTFNSDPKPLGKKWVKVNDLTDEFNVNGLDTDKWFKSTWNYDIPVEMVSDNTNSGVWGGYLWIRATVDAGAERWFRTARISSTAKISYPMYTESKIKASSISAFNTFWLNNGDSSNRDEIDVIENNAAPTCNCKPDYPWLMKSHYWQARSGTEYDEASDFDNRNLPVGTAGKGVKWDADYHIFGVYWKDARNMDFYLNGVKVGSLVSDYDYTRDLNILFDLWTKDADWLGGLALQSNVSDNSKNTMYVDWVRTWQLEDQEFFIKNRETGKKIRTNGSVDFTNLEQVPYSWSGDPTKWKMVDAGNGYFYLKNTENDKFFRPLSDNTTVTSDADGTPIVQVPNTYTGDFTKFKKVSTSATGNYFYLENKATGMYLRPETANDYSKLQQRPNTYSGTWTQWQFVDVNTGALVTKTPSDLIQEISTNSFEQTNEFTLSPNPVSQGASLHISLETLNGINKINVFDLQGNLILNDETDKANISLNTNGLKGLYVVKVENEKNAYTKKVFVQ